MSFWKSVTSVGKDIVKAINKTDDVIGEIGGSNTAKVIMDAANALQGGSGYAVNNTGTADKSESSGVGSSILSAIFGAGDNSLSSILGSVVKGAVGIGTSYFENQQYYKDQRKLNEQTFEQDKWLARQKYKYDIQAADTAYQRDVAMWNMQNAYNAPSAQMERLQKAGLNPNLVYGGGSVTGNTAGSPPSYTPASYPQVSAPSSKAQKLDLMRNVLGIFNEYQSIRNQALDNQRERFRMTLSLLEQERKNKLTDAQIRNIGALTGLNSKKIEQYNKPGLIQSIKNKINQWTENLATGGNDEVDALYNEMFGNM